MTTRLYIKTALCLPRQPINDPPSLPSTLRFRPNTPRRKSSQLPQSISTYSHPIEVAEQPPGLPLLALHLFSYVTLAMIYFPPKPDERWTVGSNPDNSAVTIRGEKRASDEHKTLNTDRL